MSRSDIEDKSHCSEAEKKREGTKGIGENENKSKGEGICEV